MKKRITSIILAVLMVLTFLPAANPALAFDVTGDPIVEGSAAIDILINAGEGSSVLASALTPELYSKIRAKLDTAGLGDVNVRISSSRVNISTTDTSDWYVYDHYDTGYYSSHSGETNTTAPTAQQMTDAKNTWNTEFAGADPKLRPYSPHTQPVVTTSGVKTTDTRVEKSKVADWVASPSYYYNATNTSIGALDQHIYTQVKDGIPYIDFVGYYNSNYQDFMYYPCSSREEKLVTFDVDASKVNAHSLFGAGFLFNAGIDSNGYIHGYVIYYYYNTEASAPTNLYLYKIKDNVKVSDIDSTGVSNKSFHDYGKSATSNIAVSTRQTELFGTPLRSIALNSSNWQAQSSITMSIKPNSISFYQRPKGGDDSTELKLIDNFTITDSTYDGFGPIVAYKGHGCARATQFTYSDIRMAYIDQTDKIFEVLSTSNFIQNADLYFIDLTDNGANRDYAEAGADAAAYMQAKGIRYITNYPNELLDDGDSSFANPPLDQHGLTVYADSGKPDGETNLNKLAEKIANYIITTYQAGITPEYGDQLPLVDPVAKFSLVQDPDAANITTTFIEYVKRDFIGQDGFPIYGYDIDSIASGAEGVNHISGYDYLLIKPNGSEVTFSSSDYNQELFKIYSDWALGTYSVTLTVTDSVGKTSAPVTVYFTITQDGVAPAVSAFALADGKLSFKVSDIGGYGAAAYGLKITAVGGGFSYDDETYETGEKYVEFSVSSGVTEGSQTAVQPISGVDMPTGEYILELIVYDQAGNTDTIKIPSINYKTEEIIGLPPNTTISGLGSTDGNGALAIDESWLGETKSIIIDGITFDVDIPARPAAPEDVEYEIDYINETTKETIPVGIEYSSDNFVSELLSGLGAPGAIYPNEHNGGDKTYKFRFAATGSDFASEPAVLPLVIPERPAAPTGISSVGESTSKGKLTDLDDTMEYKISTETVFTSVPNGETEITGLDAPGDINVRYQAVEDTEFASSTVTIAVQFLTHDVKGAILDSEGDPVDDADVVLIIGDKTYPGVSDPSGEFTIDDVPVPDGVYNIVITTSDTDEIVTTIAVEIIDGNIVSLVDGKINLPDGNKSTVLIVEPDTPPLVVGGLPEQLASPVSDSVPDGDKKGVTENDLAEIELGGKLIIEFTAEGLDEAVAPNGEDIRDFASDKTVGLYLDLSVWKYLWQFSSNFNDRNEADSTQLSELQELVTVYIPLEADMQEQTGYAVYRYHGTVNEIPQGAVNQNSDGEYFTINNGNTLILHVKKFCTYAIAYATSTNPPQPPIIVPPGNGGSNDDTASHPVTIKQSEGGTVTSELKKTAQGEILTFTIKPEIGSCIVDVIVNGVSVGAVDTYTVTDVTGEVTISAVFAWGLPYWKNGDRDLFLGFSTHPGSNIKWIEETGKTILFRPNPKNFIDLSSSHWGKNAIDYVTERELFFGVDENLFAPETGMTRAMFATVIGRLHERSYGLLPDADATFNDVDNKAYYAKYVAWASETGIVVGIGGNMYAPEREITRQEMAQILYNYIEYINITLDDVNKTPFTDFNTVSSWAQNAVEKIFGFGIIGGIGNNTFAPQNTATRAEVAQIIMNFILVAVK